MMNSSIRQQISLLAHPSSPAMQRVALDSVNTIADKITKVQ